MILIQKIPVAARVFCHNYGCCSGSIWYLCFKGPCNLKENFLMVRNTFSSLLIGLAFLLGVGLLKPIGEKFSTALAAVDSPTSTFVVTNTSDDGPGSLREAIISANANPGADLINITTSGTILLGSPLPLIADPVSIQGPGSGLLAVDGNNSFRVLDIQASEVTLADLTIQHGTLTDPSEYGAGIQANGNLVLERVELLSNTAYGSGGGLYVIGDLTITDGGIRNNVSTNGLGGGLRTIGATVISGTQFTGNTSQGDGGGAFVLEELSIQNSLFEDNYCTAMSCDGGGLFSFSTTDIQNTQFISNSAQDQAGGAAAPGILTITGSLFENNEAVFGKGGALYAQDMATILDTQFLGNLARSSGGGMYAFASVVLSNVSFQDNQSTIGAGGGLFTAGSLDITHSQFIGNSATEGGGLTHSAGSASLVNTLFAENTATNISGMALLLSSDESVEVLHTTLAGPVSVNGSAIEVTAGSTVITNSIITNHTIGINNNGGSVQQDFNLFFGNGADTQGVVSGGANSLTGDPLFIDPAGDDYHINVGSAACDTGTDSGVTIDFDGEVRPMNQGFDIGFDEVNQSPYSTYLPLISK